MNTFPCRDCGKRTPDCHASCPAYLSYKAKREAQLAAYKKERRGYDSAVAQAVACAPGRRAVGDPLDNFDKRHWFGSERMTTSL